MADAAQAQAIAETIHWHYQFLGGVITVVLGVAGAYYGIKYGIKTHETKIKALEKEKEIRDEARPQEAKDMIDLVEKAKAAIEEKMKEDKKEHETQIAALNDKREKALEHSVRQETKIDNIEKSLTRIEEILLNRGHPNGN